MTFVIGPDGRISGIDSSVNAEFSKQGGTLKTRHALDLALLLSNWRAAPGKPVPNFSFNTPSGSVVPLLVPGSQGAALLFLPAGGSVAASRDLEVFQGIALKPENKSVRFIAVLPSGAGQPDMALPNVLVVQDSGWQIGRRFGAGRGATFWTVDSGGTALKVVLFKPGAPVGRQALNSALSGLTSQHQG